MKTEGGPERVAILGVGLIGGSLGLALKRALPQARIRGIGRDRRRLEIARGMGAIDDCVTRLEEGLGDRDLVVLATPVDHILETLEIIGAFLAPGTLVTDVGSTKRAICRKAWDCLPAGIEFIGGHPVAGREVAGVEHTLADLFEGAPYILCPRPGAGSAGLRRLTGLVEGIGARARVMAPDDHDLMMAWLSHLPQLISTVLANAVSDKDMDISGSGLRDMLRLAGSPYPVWRSILDTNSDMICQSLDGFIRALERLREKLPVESLEDEFETALRIHNRLKAR